MDGWRGEGSSQHSRFIGDRVRRLDLLMLIACNACITCKRRGTFKGHLVPQLAHSQTRCVLLHGLLLSITVDHDDG